MNFLVRNLVAMGIASVGLLAALASVPAVAADDAVVAADKAVAAALAKGDQVAANKWLDADFSSSERRWPFRPGSAGTYDQPYILSI